MHLDSVVSVPVARLLKMSNLQLCLRQHRLYRLRESHRYGANEGRLSFPSVAELTPPRHRRPAHRLRRARNNQLPSDTLSRPPNHLETSHPPIHSSSSCTH